MSALLWGAVKLLLIAQASQATITGAIHDGSTGRPLAGAEVTLPDIERTSVTDPSGVYVFHSVPAGPQHLLVRAAGFESRTLHALVPAVGRLEIHATLRPAPFSMSPLIVRSRREGTSAAALGAKGDRSLTTAEFTRHPALSEADVLAALAGGDAGLAPEAPAGLTIRGAGPDHTAYLIDGVPVFSPYHAAGMVSAWNPDVIGRLEVFASRLPSTLPGALGGTVAVGIRRPGDQFGGRGSVSSNQARLAVDGPLGIGGFGYVVGLRTGIVGSLAPSDEPSYLRGGTGDRLAKVEGPAFGGRLRIVGFGSSNSLHPPVSVDAPDRARGAGPSHSYEWESGSAGIDWARDYGAFDLAIRGWTASSDAEARWYGSGGATRLDATRRDLGGFATVGADVAGGRGLLGVRFEAPSTRYRTRPADSGATGLLMSAAGPRTSLLFEHDRPLGRRMSLATGMTVSAAEGGPYVSPRLRLGLRPADRLAVEFSVSRVHQFAQSLRNSESLVGSVFPADLFVGADGAGIPVARSRQAAIGVEYRPGTAWRVGADAYASWSHDILLIAPVEGGPFAINDFGIGSAATRGVAVRGSRVMTRSRLEASYGWQRVERRLGAARFVPGHAPAHRLDVAGSVYPSPTFELRAGATAVMGRRTTVAEGGFEWESCNVLDRGCEFAGSPDSGTRLPGSDALPAYLRLDAGVRKHWHLRLGGREASLGLFATVTNVLGRSNVLTYVDDPAGFRTGIDMLPLSPLVLGLDWSF